MNWIAYSTEFSKKAQANGYTQDDIDFYLSYGKNLFDKKLPIIYDQQHLSLLVGYQEEFLLKISNSSRKFYRTFKIPKKAGGKRIISEPLPSLKEIQRWILEEILNKCRVSSYAKAYKRHQSIKDNAKFHINQSAVLTLDIKDFFPSLKVADVFNIFHNLGYSSSVSMMLSHLCCLNDSLPQGAPTSPALSNIIMNKVDKRIAGFVRKHDLHYTRYADDMTFSGNFIPGTIINFVKLVLSDMNLTINEKKTRSRKPNQRQEITGITVNSKMQVSRELRRQLRQSIYFIKKYGFASHLEKTKNQKANSLKHLMGIANFILFVNPADAETANYKNYLSEYYNSQLK
jgi:RNA-directed DNA polymerase